MTEYCQIELTQGMVARVDPEDWEGLIAHNWYARKSGDSFYVNRMSPRSEGRHIVHMHRVVMNAPAGVEVDHVRGDGLDNRKSQLRLCSHGQNSINRRERKDNKSGHRGVFYLGHVNKWWAKIKFNGKTYDLGLHVVKEDAIAAYRKAARVLHGEFSRIN